MDTQDLQIWQASFLPKVSFMLESKPAEEGLSVALRWKVSGAEGAALWSETAPPATPEPLDWRRIHELGEPVALEGTLERVVTETTSFYLVARSPQGWRGVRRIAEVATRAAAHAAEDWSPPREVLPQMELRPVRGWPVRRVRGDAASRLRELVGLWLSAEEWTSPPTPPGINLDINPGVIFTDESATLAWSITNANCAWMGYGAWENQFLADATQVSGRKYDGGGWGGGGTPYCGLSLSGSYTIQGSKSPWGDICGWNQAHGVNASNALGKSASAGHDLDVLGIPQYKGNATAARKADIRAAVKAVVANLRGGCIYNDAGLDQSVLAFKDGHLKRTSVWSELLLEMQNLQICTFTCQDTSDAAWGGGHWKDYGNEVWLDWSPSHTPNLEFVILHELIHKCGFNSGLYPYYSHASIEQQAYDVSSACYP